MLCKSLYISKVYSIHYTTMSKKLLLTKLTLRKKHSFFFRELQLITVLFLIRDSYMNWSTTLVSFKQCVGFCNFDSVLFLLKGTFKSEGAQHWKPFKNDENFLFYLDSPFRSQDISISVLTFWSCRKTAWLERSG